MTILDNAEQLASTIARLSAIVQSLVVLSRAIKAAQRDMPPAEHAILLGEVERQLGEAAVAVSRAGIMLKELEQR